MKDPQPLLDGGATELELELLQAGDADRPSPKARQAALAALGLSGAALSASSSAAATAGSTALASGARLLAAKWWVIGALVTAVGGAGVGYATRPSSPVGPPSAAVGPRLSPAPVVATVGGLPEPDASAAPSPPVTAPRERPTSSQPRGSSSSSSSSNPGIQEQITLIDRARAAVAAHQPATALAALDEYQRRFPGGVLAQEATLLRIDALLARGDKASAARLGRQFLERYPRSPMAARVKTLIDG